MRRSMQILGYEDTEGPELYTPSPVKPYYRCDSCKYFEASMACSGGLRGSPTYYLSCTHEEGRLVFVGGHNIHGSKSHNVVTPRKCPLYPKEEK